MGLIWAEVLWWLPPSLHPRLVAAVPGLAAEASRQAEAYYRSVGILKALRLLALPAYVGEHFDKRRGRVIWGKLRFSDSRCGVATDARPCVQGGQYAYVLRPGGHIDELLVVGTNIQKLWLEIGDDGGPWFAQFYRAAEGTRVCRFPMPDTFANGFCFYTIPFHAARIHCNASGTIRCVIGRWNMHPCVVCQQHVIDTQPFCGYVGTDDRVLRGMFSYSVY